MLSYLCPQCTWYWCAGFVSHIISKGSNKSRAAPLLWGRLSPVGHGSAKRSWEKWKMEKWRNLTEKCKVLFRKEIQIREQKWRWSDWQHSVFNRYVLVNVTGYSSHIHCWQNKALPIMWVFFPVNCRVTSSGGYSRKGGKNEAAWSFCLAEYMNMCV